jgi:hypothetical protein
LETLLPRDAFHLHALGDGRCIHFEWGRRRPAEAELPKQDSEGYDGLRSPGGHDELRSRATIRRRGEKHSTAKAPEPGKKRANPP